MFIKLKKKRNIIGFNISTLYKMLGRVSLIEGLCLSKKGKNNGLVNTSITVRIKIGVGFFFVKFFIFFGSAFKYKVIGFSYKKKKINFSKISAVRLA
jgi:DNA polymerase sigma